MNISTNIRTLRKKIGFSQFELAEEINVSVDSVRRWESNKQLPRADELSRLALVFHCTESELLNGPNDGQIKVTLSYDWEDFKKGEINMSESKFNLVLGDNGEVGINGSMKVTSKSAIDEVIARIRKELEFGLAMQVKRGIIQEA